MKFLATAPLFALVSCGPLSEFVADNPEVPGQVKEVVETAAEQAASGTNPVLIGGGVLTGLISIAAGVLVKKLRNAKKQASES